MTEEKLDRLLGNLLRIGVLLAASLVVIGGVGFLAAHGSTPANHRVFHGEPAPMHTIPGILDEAGAAHSLGLIQLGLLILILTPVARVTFSVFAFAFTGDRLYVVFTLTVLTLLGFSLASGYLGVI